MKEVDALELRDGDRVLLRDGKVVIIDDINRFCYENNKTLPQAKGNAWIAAGYADEEHPYGVRVWLFPAQIKRKLGGER